MPEVTDEELTELRAQAESAATLTAELAAVREGAARDLREAVVAGHPDLPPELIAGATAGELAASVERAQSLVAAVRESALEDVRNMAAGKPPIGFRPPVKAGEGRTPVGPPEGVTGAARIRWALDNEGGK